MKTRVGRSLTCCNEESIYVLGLQSGVGGDQRRPRPTHNARRGTAVQAVQALIHRHAQFEGDALRNVQPVQFVVEDVRQTPVELPSASDAFRTRCSLSVVALGAFASSALP